ncbi:MAG: hypothetical protein EPN30_09430, partial [Actinomycetota bacterium]
MNQSIAVQRKHSVRTVRKFLSMKGISGVMALIPVAALILTTIILFVEALPAIKFNGLGFLIHSQWRPGNFYVDPVTTSGVSHPAGASYGALPLIVGTIESSALALIIAIPISIGAALVIVEKLPNRISQTIGLFLEILAGIPSVIFGLWGSLVLGPFLARYIFPFVSRTAPNVIGF